MTTKYFLALDARHECLARRWVQAVRSLSVDFREHLDMTAGAAGRGALRRAVASASTVRPATRSLAGAGGDAIAKASAVIMDSRRGGTEEEKNLARSRVAGKVEGKEEAHGRQMDRARSSSKGKGSENLNEGGRSAGRQSGLPSRTAENKSEGTALVQNPPSARDELNDELPPARGWRTLTVLTNMVTDTEDLITTMSSNAFIFYLRSVKDSGLRPETICWALLFICELRPRSFPRRIHESIPCHAMQCQRQCLRTHLPFEATDSECGGFLSITCDAVMRCNINVMWT